MVKIYPVSIEPRKCHGFPLSVLCKILLHGMVSQDSGDSYVIYIAVANIMVRKCIINGGTATPYACVSWPGVLAIPLWSLQSLYCFKLILTKTKVLPRYK